MATVPHVTSGLGLRKFQADGFLLTRVYTPNGNVHISLQIWVRFGLVNLRLVPLSTYEFRVSYDSENHSLLYVVNEFLSIILTFLPISITLAQKLSMQCHWVILSNIKIQNTEVIFYTRTLMKFCHSFIIFCNICLNFGTGRGLVWSCGLCVRFAGCFSRETNKAPNTTGSNHPYNSWAPDDGHNGARNMLSEQ